MVFFLDIDAMWMVALATLATPNEATLKVVPEGPTHYADILNIHTKL